MHLRIFREPPTLAIRSLLTVLGIKKMLPQIAIHCTHKTIFAHLDTAFNQTPNMKLHLIILASVFNLSSGFMAELKGPLTEEACTGQEYADFKNCVMMAAAADPNLAEFTDIEDEAFVNRGDDRKLSCYCCPSSGAPKGHWCYVMCGSRRRLLETAGMDSSNLRRDVQEADTAVVEDGAYTGNIEAILILEDITQCLEDVSTNHPCLGSTDTMTLTVTL
jgi:hypothetical protein